MALKKVKGNLERMFDKNMSDLVRGIRNNKDNEVTYSFDLQSQLMHIYYLRIFFKWMLTSRANILRNVWKKSKSNSARTICK